MSLFKKPLRKVIETFVHQSASDNPLHDDISVMEKWHLEKKYNGVGYHYFIKTDGTIQPGRDLERVPAAQLGHNTGTISICLHGINKSFTKAQFDSLRLLCGEINKAYNNKMRFRGHKEVYATLCPQYDYIKELNLNADGYMKG